MYPNASWRNVKSPFTALPGTLRNVTALVSVATIEIITAQPGIFPSPRKYPLIPSFSPFAPIRAPRAVQPTR